MIEKTRVELRRGALVKATRAAIRTRHSIAADEELNAVLPRVERLFDERVQRGELAEAVDLNDVVREALRGVKALP